MVFPQFIKLIQFPLDGLHWVSQSLDLGFNFFEARIIDDFNRNLDEPHSVFHGFKCLAVRFNSLCCVSDELFSISPVLRIVDTLLFDSLSDFLVAASGVICLRDELLDFNLCVDETK